MGRLGEIVHIPSGMGGVLFAQIIGEDAEQGKYQVICLDKEFFSRCLFTKSADQVFALSDADKKHFKWCLQNNRVEAVQQ